MPRGTVRPERRRWFTLALVVTAAVVLLAGCVGQPTGSTTAPDRSAPDVQHDGPTPTVVHLEDGVEVWDLTGTPSVEAFGVDTDGEAPVRNAVAAYSSTDDRPARFVLPGGRVVDLPVGEVIVAVDDFPDGLTDSSGEVITPAGRSFVLQVEGPSTSGAAAGLRRTDEHSTRQTFRRAARTSCRRRWTRSPRLIRRRRAGGWERAPAYRFRTGCPQH